MKKDLRVRIIFILVFSVMFLLSYFIANQIKNNKLNSDKQTVYVSSTFGCLPLEHKYTNAEWEVKKDLDNRVLGYSLKRCVDGNGDR